MFNPRPVRTTGGVERVSVEDEPLGPQAPGNRERGHPAPIGFAPDHPHIPSILRPGIDEGLGVTGDALFGRWRGRAARLAIRKVESHHPMPDPGYQRTEGSKTGAIRISSSSVSQKHRWGRRPVGRLIQMDHMRDLAQTWH
ncbi:MAG TPA: hypothetical protein VI541_05955 [Actinomycetota bacterium]|nr:hypothetical protein [Actinomycetota bacterium]